MTTDRSTDTIAGEREPDRPPRAYWVECDCGFESTPFQKKQSAHNRAASHERYCEADAVPKVTGVDYVADGAGQTCRRCEHTTRAWETLSDGLCPECWDEVSIVADGGVPVDEFGQLPDSEGQPGTSANTVHPYENDIPDAAVHLRVAADMVEDGDRDGARWATEKALGMLERDRDE